MERGAVLIDVLVAITVVSMGVLSLSQASVHINSVRKECEEKEMAEFAIDREVEVLRQASFATLPSKDGRSFDQSVDVDGDGRADVSQLAVSTIDADLVQVQLSVTWTSEERKHLARRSVWFTNRRGLGGS